MWLPGCKTRCDSTYSYAAMFGKKDDHRCQLDEVYISAHVKNYGYKKALLGVWSHGTPKLLKVYSAFGALSEL